MLRLRSAANPAATDASSSARAGGCHRVDSSVGWRCSTLVGWRWLALVWRGLAWVDVNTSVFCASCLWPATRYHRAKCGNRELPLGCRGNRRGILVVTSPLVPKTAHVLTVRARQPAGRPAPGPQCFRPVPTDPRGRPGEWGRRAARVGASGGLWRSALGGKIGVVRPDSELC